MADADTDSLLDRVQLGDSTASVQLMERYRHRIHRMAGIRMDAMLRARIDPSDVVQETLIEAASRLSEYARHRPIRFYPWLRAIAWDKLCQLRQHHLKTQKRSVLREERGYDNLPDSSTAELAQRLLAATSSPSHILIRDELHERVRSVLACMSDLDREVLVLRYLEQIPAKDAIVVLGISESAYMKRHVRALQRLRKMLDDESLGDFQ